MKNQLLTHSGLHWFFSLIAIKRPQMIKMVEVWLQENEVYYSWQITVWLLIDIKKKNLKKPISQNCTYRIAHNHDISVDSNIVLEVFPINKGKN